MDLIERVENIILRPSHEWGRIETEDIQIADLYKTYIMPLAAVGPVASSVFFSFVGITKPFEGIYYLPLVVSISQAILYYALSLIGVYAVALSIEYMAPRFSAQRNRIQAFKVSAYSHTPIWLAGIFNLFPSLGVLYFIFSVYTFYLLYLGLAVLMKSSGRRRVLYVIVIGITMVLIFVAIALLRSILVGVFVQPNAEYSQ
jgi:hypothetical protein